MAVTSVEGPGGLQFDWDPDKAETNFEKHGVRFEEAATAFADALSVSVNDTRHSMDEDRQFLLGMSDDQHLVAVWYTYRDERIRLIGARLADDEERASYESKVPGNR